MTAPYFNEIDPVACAVLRATNPGAHVDERSVKDVQPDDVRSFRRAHFFAGAGLWQIAAELAGWGDRPLWTASCPCQGESVAGKKLGADDPRHLWPDLFRLVRAVRPPVLMGEQVDRAAGTHWLDGVWSDLEAEGYSFRAVDLPACSIDAPHRRQRLYWVAVLGVGQADPDRERRQVIGGSQHAWLEGSSRRLVERRDADGGIDGPGTMADADGGGYRGRPEDAIRGEVGRDAAERADGRRGRTVDNAVGDGQQHQNASIRAGWNAADAADGVGVALGDTERAGLEGLCRHVDDGNQPGWFAPGEDRHAATPNGSFWSDSEWLRCADGKARRAPRQPERGLRSLVDGMAGGIDPRGDESDRRAQVDYSLLVPSHPGRADLWRLVGNSIVPQVAAEVLIALKETLAGGDLP